MTLTHTQQSGYIRLDDVYTDDDGVEYTVYPDIDAEDPRTWLTHEEAALVVIDADRHTQTDNINDYDDNPVINDLLRTMEQNDIKPGDITPKWWDAYVDSPESAVEEYIDNYRPTQRQLTLF